MLPKCLFLHIHKTAGGSFGYVIKSLYKDKCKRFKEGDLRNRDKAIINEYLDCGYLCVFGHFERYYIEDPMDYKLVTFLRHPVERTISHYFYMRDFTNKMEDKISLLEFAERTRNIRLIL